MEKPTKYHKLNWRYPGFKAKALTLSYDDGRTFDRKMVEILDHYGIRCTFNLSSGFLVNERYITPEEVPELFKNHEVAIHSLTHPQLGSLTSAGVCYELIEDRKFFENIMKRPVEGMAYPNGLREFPGLVEAVKACGLRYARTVNTTFDFELPNDYLRWCPTCHQNSPRLDEMIDAFLAPFPYTRPFRIQPKLLYIWGHSYEYEFDWPRLANMCQKLAGHDEIWYATNIEIIDYLDAIRSLRPSVDGRYIYNPTHIPLYVNANNVDIILQPGVINELPVE